MSSEQMDVVVGEPMPECDIRLRADGTVEHGAYFLDAVQLHLVLGVDVSPWHERAIIQASQPSGPGGRSLWVWCLMTRQPFPAMGLSLWLRPGPIPLPDVAWLVPADAAGLCCCCVSQRRQEALSQHDQLMADRAAGMQATIILVGRDHKVLGISRVPCHGLLAAVWQEQLLDDAADDRPLSVCGACGWYWQGQPGKDAADQSELVGPEIQGFPAVMCHPADQPHLMDAQDLDRYLVGKGWRESAKQRLRHKRQRARRRQGP